MTTSVAVPTDERAPPEREVLPRAAIVAVAAALVTTLAGVGLYRAAGGTPMSAGSADTPAVAARTLHFRDRPDGGIAIVDAASGATIDTAHGEQGFLRGTLRALVRERKQRGLPADAPLHLTARAGGRLTLADPATGARIDLESFGPTNAAVFARWLPPVKGATP